MSGPKKAPLVVTYNPANPDFNQILKKHWPILELSKRREAFKDGPMVAYRRPKNIADELVRAKCPRSDHTTQTQKQHPAFHRNCPLLQIDWLRVQTLAQHLDTNDSVYLHK